MDIDSKSQASQDIFVKYILDDLDKGYFLDIGSYEPIHLSNSYSLEQVGWDGLLFDITDYTNVYKDVRKSKFICGDITKMDLSTVFRENNVPSVIDYVSIDVDESTDTFLDIFPFDEYECKVITFEHDAYRIGEQLKNKSREIFKNKWYKLLCSDVGVVSRTDNDNFEDWYVNEKYIDIKKFEHLISDKLVHTEIVKKMKRKNKMGKLIFYNNFHNGDIHFTRQFIKDIMKKTSYDEYYFLHQRSHKLLLDIPNLKYGPLTDKCKPNMPSCVINDETYINTHMGVYDIFVEKVTDVSLNVFYDYFQIIFNRLRIPMEKKRFYLPTIDYSVFELSGITEYIQNNPKQIKILVCNGDVHSSQSGVVDFKQLIEKLSVDFPDMHFILTDKKDVIEKPNVFYTSDIIKAVGDLNEISYLSTLCGAIIGRASGPYSFTEVKENMDDVDKTFIFICNVFSDGAWCDKTLCSKVWINNYEFNNILNTVTGELKKLNNYNNLINVVSKDNKIIITPKDNIPFKVRIDFYSGKDLLYDYKTDLVNGIFHWIMPHGYYYTGMEVKCKFYKDETNEYLFQKIV